MLSTDWPMADKGNRWQVATCGEAVRCRLAGKMLVRIGDADERHQGCASVRGEKRLIQQGETMATAKQRNKGGITLKLSQDEADLIHAVFGDLFSTNAPGANRERDVRARTNCAEHVGKALLHKGFLRRARA